jgi:hypothetical protein
MQGRHSGFTPLPSSGNMSRGPALHQQLLRIFFKNFAPPAARHTPRVPEQPAFRS